MWIKLIPTGKAARVALHTGLLFAAMLAAYVAAGPMNFLAATGVVYALGAGYYLWPMIRHRKRWAKRKAGFQGVMFIFVTQISGCFVAIAIVGAAGLLWLSNAYRWDSLRAHLGLDPAGSGFPSAPPELADASWMMVYLLLAAAVVFGFAIAIRPWVERRMNAENPTPLRGHDVPGMLSFWFDGILGIITAYAPAVLTASGFAYFLGLDALWWDRALTTTDLFLHLPVLPLGFLVLAGMVVVLRDHDIQLMWDTGKPADAESKKAPPKILGIGMPGLAMASAAGFAAFGFAALYLIHIFVFVMGTAAPALSTGGTTKKALDEWAAEQRSAGRPDAEIAAEINESGHWSPDVPAEGLARLLPNLFANPEFEIAGWTCPVTVTAGAIDAAELEAAPWPELPDTSPVVLHEENRAFVDYINESSEERKREEAEKAAAEPEYDEDKDDNEDKADNENYPPPIRYCVKVTCPGPAPWPASGAVVLISSHATTVPQWLYIGTLQARGRTTPAGGYCTAEGDLADSFQG